MGSNRRRRDARKARKQEATTERDIAVPEAPSLTVHAGLAAGQGSVKPEDKKD